MDGQRAAVADRRVPRRPRDEGGAAGRDRRPGADDAGAGDEVEPAVRAGVRYLRHRRRRRAHVQRLDGRGAGAGRLRRARSRSTATAAPRAAAAAPICSRRWASTSRRHRAVVERCLEEAGIAFLFAQVFHPSMRHAAPTRKELGVQDGVQPARPADESRGRVAPAGRRAAAGAHRAGRAIAGAARRGARLGRARRRRPRRDLDDRLHQGVRVPRRRGQHVLPAPGGRRAGEVRARGAARRRCRRQRGDRARGARRAARRAAGHRPAQCRRRRC